MFKPASLAVAAAALSAASLAWAAPTASSVAAAHTTAPGATVQHAVTHVWPREDRVAEAVGNRLILVKPVKETHSLIAEFPTPVTSVVASPNGHFLFFIVGGDIWTSTVGVAKSSTRIFRPFTSALQLWLRRGAVYFTVDGQSGTHPTFWRMNWDGTDAHQVQVDHWMVPPSGVGLSPDARRAAFGDEYGNGIKIVSVKRGRVVRRLDVGSASEVTWSRNGLWLLFDQHGPHYGVVRVRPDGTDRHVILRERLNHASYGTSSWSYNNRHILAVGQYVAHKRLLAANAFAMDPEAQRVPGSAALRGFDRVLSAAWFRIR
jgi:hypothetical protein